MHARAAPTAHRCAGRWGGRPSRLVAAAQAQHQVQRGLLLDVVVCQGAAVLQLLAGEDEALLVRGNALLVLQGGEKHAATASISGSSQASSKGYAGQWEAAMSTATYDRADLHKQL